MANGTQQKLGKLVDIGKRLNTRDSDKTTIADLPMVMRLGATPLALGTTASNNAVGS